MAEVAGLIVGGISLTALFDHCITIVKHFDSGASCEDEFQDAALMLILLGGRLGRWERTLRDNADLQATEEDGETAEHWLKQIRKRLEEAEKFGSRYAVEQRAAAATTTTTTAVSERSREISRMLGQLRRVLKQGTSLSLTKRARWALFDQEKMSALVDKLDKLISSLEVLFNSLHSQRIRMAKTDATELLQSFEGETLQALEALRIAAAKVDQDFDTAATSSSHTYRNIDVTDRATVSAGDFYSEEWARASGPIGRGGSHSYDGIHISGDSNVSMGNVYGSKGVPESKST